MTRDEAIRRAEKITREVWPTLKKALGGKPPEVQGMVLADMTAIWLAGHRIANDPVKTAEYRETLLAVQVAAIRDLVEKVYTE